MGMRSLTELLEHLVALIEDEMFDMTQVECLVARQCQDPAWCPHYNVWTVLLQHLFVLLDRQPSEEHCHLQAKHTCITCCETGVELQGTIRQTL